jgi:hypothetical protein
MSVYVLTPLAKADIFNIWSHIAENSEIAADRVEQAIYEGLRICGVRPNATSHPTRHHHPSAPFLDANQISELPSTPSTHRLGRRSSPSRPRWPAPRPSPCGPGFFETNDALLERDQRSHFVVLPRLARELFLFGLDPVAEQQIIDLSRLAHVVKIDCFERPQLVLEELRQLRAPRGGTGRAP